VSAKGKGKGVTRPTVNTCNAALPETLEVAAVRHQLIVSGRITVAYLICYLTLRMLFDKLVMLFTCSDTFKFWLEMW